MKKYLIISSVFILPLASGAYIIKDMLESKYKKTDLDLDNTRFGTQDYGMKWGSKTDEIVIVYILKKILYRLNPKLKLEI